MLSACILHKGRPREKSIDFILQQVMALPAERTWKVEWSEAKSERSISQNKYLFAVPYKLLSDHTGYEKDDLHDYLLGKHFGTRIKRVPKTRYNPEGKEEVPVRTTTTDENGNRSVLGKLAFAEYVEFVRRFGARLGVAIPEPDPEWRLHQREAA